VWAVRKPPIKVEIAPSLSNPEYLDSQEWYLGPEIPGLEPVPEIGFKDIFHKIKRQVCTTFKFKFLQFCHSPNRLLVSEFTRMGRTVMYSEK